MEVPFDSFSIREYTARMRRADASKCWPFDGDGRDRQLPPIEYRRFRWWSSELQIARSAGACEPRTGATEHECGTVPRADATVITRAVGGGGAGEPPVVATGGEPSVHQQAIVVLPAPVSTVEEDEDGEEEGRQARSPGKPKVKTPKKRSIVELFAVAPQIEAVEDEGDGDDDGKALAVDEGSEEGPKDDVLDKNTVEEPRKRREGSVETLTRKKIKKNYVKKSKENEEKMKNKTRMMRKHQQKLLKKQKKQKTSTKIGIAKKEKICKLGLQSPVDFARLLQDKVIMQRFGGERKVPVSAQGKKHAKSKSAAKQDKVKAIQTSKSKKWLSEPIKFPVQSILKNQKTVSSPAVGKVHSTDVSQNGEGHHSQQSEKHVRFSGKDDILGHGERHCSPLGSPQMQSLCKVFSDVLAASSVVEKSLEGAKLSESNSKAQVVTREDIFPDRAANGKAGEPLLFQQSTDIHDVNNADASANSQSCHAEKAALDDRVDLNSSVQVYGNLKQIDPCPTEPLSKDMNSSRPEECDPQVVDDAGKETSKADAARSLSPGSAAVVMLTNIVRNSNSELAVSSVDVVANKSQHYPVLQHHKDMYAYDPQFQSSCLLKRDAASTIYSTRSMEQFSRTDDFPDSRLKVNPVDVFHDKHKHDSRNIVGLPLNSQGEYIHLRSSAQFGFDQLFNKQKAALGPVSSFLAHNSMDPSSMGHISVKGKVPQSSACIENQQNWVPEKSYPRGRSVVMPESGFTELQDISQTEVRNKVAVRRYDQFVSNPNVEANLFRVPCHGFREQNRPYSHNERGITEPGGASEPGFQSVTQPTMRLMGKNFIIAGCNKNKEHQGSGDSNIWADKKMIADLGPSLRMSEGTIPKQRPRSDWATHPTSGASYENLIHTLEKQKKTNASNFYHLTVDPQSENAYLDYGRDFMPGSSCHSISLSHAYKLDPFSHPHAPEAWVSNTSVSKKNCGSESVSVKTGFQSPLAVCNPENLCQHLLLNSTYCEHSQSLSPSMTSTFSPPTAFQNPDNEKYVQLPLAQCSSQSLPHWLLNAGQQRKTSNSSLSFLDPVPKNEPCTKSGTNIFSLPSPPLASMMSFPSLGQNSRVCFSDLPTPASVVHSSLFPSFPSANSSTTNGTCFWTMCDHREDTNSKYSFVKSSDCANKTRKRFAPSNNDFLKAVKRPNLCIQDNSRAPMGSKKGEQLHACTEHISKILELHSYGDKMVQVNDAVKDAHVNAHAPSASKLHTRSRSRPIKLTAGAKHILKPSLNIGQDNSMPTHSTIPFAHGTSSGKVPVSQKKPAKIYQF